MATVDRLGLFAISCGVHAKSMGQARMASNGLFQFNMDSVHAYLTGAKRDQAPDIACGKN